MAPSHGKEVNNFDGTQLHAVSQARKNFLFDFGTTRTFPITKNINKRVVKTASASLKPILQKPSAPAPAPITSGTVSLIN